jgi:lipoyl-dependent peroxiredoxin
MKSNAAAIWRGKGKEGSGSLTTKSKVLNSVPYSYKTRFEGPDGTNPEEMIAAAHAGCFAMKLSFVTEGAGCVAEELNVNCEITLEAGTITGSHLTLKAKIPGMNKETFDKCVEDASKNCPISKLLNTKITVDATLVNAASA